MYQYDQYDQTIVNQRVEQFRDQVARRLRGEIRETEFKPLRLQNGLYRQLHAYMLRVAIPYGLLSSRQLRKLAYIARRYDRGYGHWSTRQNIQFNWPNLVDVPDILAELASVEMHAIQTSGNCVRNISADHLAGVARDELEDPRPYCELLRQWSTFHPEFAYLPRKFKIAITGAQQDRAAVRIHDIGIRIVENEQKERGFEILVGGGLGRTPRIAQVIRNFLPYEHLLSYVEAILRVYNQFGRRDNKFKARIKILVESVGIDEFRRLVDAEWEFIRDSALKLPRQEIERIKQFFATPNYENLANSDAWLERQKLTAKREFARWLATNVKPHKQPGYSIVMISCKSPGRPPGDMTAEEMEQVAQLAEDYSYGQIVVTHEQNLVLADVKTSDLELVWNQLASLELAEPNVGTVTDIISCPGLDYCDLANARSIPVAQRISQKFTEIDFLHDLGELTLNISGCINACGHHHVGHIGLLGIDKAGEEYYQVMLGGCASDDASLGKIIGPAFASKDIVDAIDKVLHFYVTNRVSRQERFLDFYRRLGPTPFKEILYAPNH